MKNNCEFDENGDYVCEGFTMEADYAYDSAGRISSYGTQAANIGETDANPLVYSYSYDGMGRPSGMTEPGMWDPCCGVRTWVQNVQYDFAGRRTNMATLGFDNDSAAWDASGRLVSQWAPNGLQYVYSASQDNGQMAQVRDWFRARRSATNMMR